MERESEIGRRVEKINENIHIIIILYKTFNVLNLSSRKKRAAKKKNKFIERKMNDLACQAIYFQKEKKKLKEKKLLQFL